ILLDGGGVSDFLVLFSSFGSSTHISLNGVFRFIVVDLFGGLSILLVVIIIAVLFSRCGAELLFSRIL
ncbi:hypothetical protein PENTCL1PPCAC_30018, partial [Pristionchus entomophagus]